MGQDDLGGAATHARNGLQSSQRVLLLALARRDLPGQLLDFSTQAVNVAQLRGQDEPLMWADNATESALQVGLLGPELPRAKSANCLGIGHAGDGRSIVATKSAISRRFVQGTGQKLAELFGRDLSQLDLLAISIDGIEIVEHCVVLALGDDAEGRKHPLGLWEGTIENKTVGNALLGNLIERGLDPSSRRCS